MAILAHPTPGNQYTVVAGDRITFISQRAYGTEANATLIVEANAQLTGRAISLEDLPTIFPGDILNIPHDAPLQAIRTEATKLTIPGKEPDDFTLIADGLEIPVMSGRVIRTMDTPADGWTAQLAWFPGEDKEIDKRLLPFALPEAAVYLGGKLRINGILYGVNPGLKDDGSTKDLAGFSFTADAIDSTIMPPYEVNGLTLKQRADQLLAPIGIRAVFDTEVGAAFERMTAEPTDTIVGHLTKYAAQRGILISSTPSGDLLFLRANTDGEPVGTLQEGRTPVTAWAATYDGRKIFNAYKAIGQTPGQEANVAVATDEDVPRARSLTFKSDDATTGDIQGAADWKRSKQLAEALGIQLPVDSWYAPNGELWEENTLVTVISETLDIPDGFTYLITKVEPEFQTGGTPAVITLVPPQVYTGEPVTRPWKIS